MFKTPTVTAPITDDLSIDDIPDDLGTEEIKIEEPKTDKKETQKAKTKNEDKADEPAKVAEAVPVDDAAQPADAKKTDGDMPF